MTYGNHVCKYSRMSDVYAEDRSEGNLMSREEVNMWASKAGERERGVVIRTVHVRCSHMCCRVPIVSQLVTELVKVKCENRFLRDETSHMIIVEPLRIMM